MELLDYKIAYEWAYQLVQYLNGSQIAQADRYAEAVNLKNAAKKLFDEKCREFILKEMKKGK